MAWDVSTIMVLKSMNVVVGVLWARNRLGGGQTRSLQSANDKIEVLVVGGVAQMTKDDVVHARIRMQL